ncbi:MAG TPA: DNA alkylation repair protein [Marinilabiliaceae bacterium]|nr:DNA alkylation repair protein [Marinilabiliaceae bacterium]
MKFFVFNEELDIQLKRAQSRIRQLKSGEISEQLIEKGLDYKKNFGVSLVHLRNLSKEFQPSNELADRLWHLGYRETCILATMLALPNEIKDEMLEEWSKEITNIEIAEQISFNLLGKRINSDNLLKIWLSHSQTYTKYAALMSIGWQFRFLEVKNSLLIRSNIASIKTLSINPTLTRAATHCLKMAGRFDTELKSEINDLANQWKTDSNKRLQQAGEEILFELELAQ